MIPNSSYYYLITIKINWERRTLHVQIFI
jgi:hypothetical protein